MKIPIIVIGAQWGDEGKGKIIDFLSKSADYVVRFNGGNNAGHTVVLKSEKYPLSLLPSGVLRRKKLLISQGVVINPKVLITEINFFQNKGIVPSLTIDKRVNLVMPYHQLLDAATEEAKGDKKVGSLKLGIGYCYEDRNNRYGIRLEDLLNPQAFKRKLEEEFELKKRRIEKVFKMKVTLNKDEIYQEYLKYGTFLKSYIGDVSLIVTKYINKKQFLFEGAHGTFLDGNFGTYPFTTAVNTISGSVFPYVGFPPQKLNIIAVVKAYTTRVGGGPFPTELFDDSGIRLQEKGIEFGTVSKRKRRCGWLDFPMLKYAHRLNGFTSIAITKLDVLSGLPEIKIAYNYRINGSIVDEFPSNLPDIKKIDINYEIFKGWKEDIVKIRKYTDLPKNCRIYLQAIEKELKIPISYISVGAERSAIIQK
ncbi:adenylosuccinate synthase [Candidatus Gottesmanbacteria bacterium CG11_big_fil_rev_8_21_14_0_20_37_11]|uniref:Adenylosuccinate synthetase n=3 Tax=Candidatus Gottesmaniibacteriota TaxID=1752720 RepID=A0A2M7RQR1_9BACT|nr:MAG: adenylosuccinate synthase [Candidatus Gottesmanbacteria bacterium CG1_02_37_22]PIP32482.1 MAG: adenylosuccinate synthase [Candidatus Gottesmanbacteria bacterium CG23_combo_of_CG06-09_8_20_14_all_37_19]PIR08855.1 MAG: adenylosuccinate synthase [Candidatus Gottesmanbacteria bacterium CG11_big_fil_rev_8_21_14_0_20_37_11]PIZ02530.1 MAG: adenylosuccinate synthase [Candidatus Gottesmanbacteria bacterium CG_4_10_14_0_8_um_filter_37_24]